MFQTIIVEDERPILELMKYEIGQNSRYCIVGAFTNPLEALARIVELKPDVAFIDVEMPKMNGLELAQKLGELSEDTKIVFTTAHKEYALEAFKVYAFDYILKPVTSTAIERVAERLVKQGHPAAKVKSVAQVSVRCFGGLEVRNAAGELVRFPTRKTEELFAYFLCHPGHEINKWQLVEMLWQEMNEERSLHNLYNTIYRLKKLLKEHNLGMDIQKTNEGYLLESANYTYDVLAFERFDFSLSTLAGMRNTAQAELLCSLYKGPLLQNKDYMWKMSLEERYCKQYMLLVRALAHRDMAEKQWDKAEQRLDTYLSVYPLDEEINHMLIDLYGACGKTEKADQHFANSKLPT
ncbi:response regulator [Paenibacillus sp. D2_2]|uniref:response regulator n=1 Tax=Paenibacillus sp. D2_2 TaxID=3073092 RepID=UPI002815CDCF|nr:response regulator [Paenibacillus sp. D2_2]WMT40452.1 response regulator [Paenibacillus sp. D2_2]